VDEYQAAGAAYDNGAHIEINLDNMEGLAQLVGNYRNYTLGGHVDNIGAGIKPHAKTAHHEADAGEQKPHDYALRRGEKAEYPHGKGVAVAEKEAGYKLEQYPGSEIPAENDKLQQHKEALPKYGGKAHFNACGQVEHERHGGYRR